MSPRALILTVFCAVLAALLLALLSTVLWLRPNGPQAQRAAPIDRGPEQAGSPSEARPSSTRIDELEERVRELEGEVRKLGEAANRTQVPSAAVQSSISSDDAFIEQHRAAINRVIDDSRHEQAWMKEKDELHAAACQLTGMGMIGYLGDQVRDDLRDVLVREFKPVFDVQWRVDESHRDPKVLAELAGALKQAQRGFYAALTARFPVELADRAFACSGTMPYLVSYRDTAELHAEIERGLR